MEEFELVEFMTPIVQVGRPICVYPPSTFPSCYWLLVLVVVSLTRSSSAGSSAEFQVTWADRHKGRVKKQFRTEQEYNDWKSNLAGMKGVEVKYYKGLGTYTAADADEFFSDLDKHTVKFSLGTDPANADFDMIKMFFTKTEAAKRKEWIKAAQVIEYMKSTVETLMLAICVAQEEGVSFIPPEAKEITVKQFVSKELIHYVLADNRRSIACLMDGLKPSQRKVLFTCIDRNITSDMRVAQLSGYVSSHCAYHHGEASLNDAIVKMAQDFVGSNNINLLVPAGSFGSRGKNGKDAASPRYCSFMFRKASPNAATLIHALFSATYLWECDSIRRYIHTRLHEITRYVFHPDDDELLTRLEDDGVLVEPCFYVPVIPMVLVNGAEGIGTGWSTSVPSYHPEDLVAYLLAKLNGTPTPRLRPYVRGFRVRGACPAACEEKVSFASQGVIEPDISEPDKRYKCKGVWARLGARAVVITEVPIGFSTVAYKKHLVSMLRTEKNIRGRIEVTPLPS